MEEPESILDDIRPTETAAPFYLKVLTNIIDWVIEIILLVTIYYFLSWEFINAMFLEGKYMSYILIFSLFFLYRAICIFLIGRTIGMVVCNIKYLNKERQPLTNAQKAMAVFATTTSTIRYYKM